MKWIPGGMSPDIEDRRGSGGFGGGGVRVGLGGMLVLFVLSLIFGRDFLSLVSPGGSPAPVNQADRVAGNDTEVQFVSFVLDDIQRTWDQVLGTRYHHAKLVLFRDAVQSACGFAQAATGPFYCPGDEKVYIDLSFYQELAQRFGASGDFAQAYVLAHEIGHHVQNLLGIGGRDSVRVELQADCLAGVWGHSTAQRDLLERGDIEEGINAAAAVGDDRIQRMAGRRVSPETFTHGSSAQRASWFRRGIETGRIDACQP